MAKRKYSVPFEGGVLTRSTDREYTHVIVAKRSSGTREVSWAGSEEKARTRAQQFTNMREERQNPINKKYQRIGPKIFSSVDILKV
jgi:hypothetical protein